MHHALQRPALAVVQHRGRRLGKAQAAGFMRILNAMFNRVVPVASPRDAAATDAEIRGVLEPVLEDYAFVTPADSGTSTYAASLRYTIRLYSPQGELTESWTFTGYGAQSASQFPGKGAEALAQVGPAVQFEGAAVRRGAEQEAEAAAALLEAVRDGWEGRVLPDLWMHDLRFVASGDLGRGVAEVRAGVAMCGAGFYVGAIHPRAE